MPEPERIVVVRNESQAVPAIASFFIPGLGQLAQGRVLSGLVWLAAAITLGVLTVGILSLPIAVFAAIDAARYRTAEPVRRSPWRLVLLLVLLAGLVALMAVVMQNPS